MLRKKTLEDRSVYFSHLQNMDEDQNMYFLLFFAGFPGTMFLGKIMGKHLQNVDEDASTCILDEF